MEIMTFKNKFDWMSKLLCKIDKEKTPAEVHFKCFKPIPLLNNLYLIATEIFESEFDKGTDPASVRWFYEFEFEIDIHTAEVVFQYRIDADGNVNFLDEWDTLNSKVVVK